MHPSSVHISDVCVLKSLLTCVCACVSVFSWCSAAWCCQCSPPSLNTRSSPTKASSSWYEPIHAHIPTSASIVILSITLFLTRLTYFTVFISTCVCVDFVCWWRHRQPCKQVGGFRCCWLRRKSQTRSTNPNSYTIIPLPPLFLCAPAALVKGNGH